MYLRHIISIINKATMFYKSKLLICFHSVAFFAIRIISAMYTYQTNLIDLSIHSDIGKRFYTTLLFMILIMFINMWELLQYWVNSREKEFYIYRMIGANKKQIMKKFLFDYIGIIIISVILGMILSFIFSLLPLRYSKAIRNSFKPVLGIYIISYLIPMLMGSAMVWRQQNVRNFE